jgi:hypothetical protein
MTASGKGLTVTGHLHLGTAPEHGIQQALLLAVARVAVRIWPARIGLSLVRECPLSL